MESSHLTPIEERMYELISRRHGKVVTLDELESVLGYEFHGLSDVDVVRTHISNLRHKVVDEIANVRGKGYRLVVARHPACPPIAPRSSNGEWYVARPGKVATDDQIRQARYQLLRVQDLIQSQRASYKSWQRRGVR